MAKRRLTEDTPFLRTPDMYQIENDAPITEYSERTLDLIADAKNGGIPDGANAFCSVGKEKRGTVQMQLFAEIDPETETFVEVGFRSHGCLAAIACATALATMLRGKTFDEALAITKEEILEAVWGRDYYGEVKIVDVNICRTAASIRSPMRWRPCAR